MQGVPMQGGPMQAAPSMEPMGDPVGIGACFQSISAWEAFGDFTYLRPRGANVTYGAVFNTTPSIMVAGVPTALTSSNQLETSPTSGIPVAQVASPGTASIDYHPGFRLGFAKALDECNAVVATFSHYEGEDHDSISATAPALIRSLVSNPATWGYFGSNTPIPYNSYGNELSDWVSANSDYQMIYSLADVDFRWTFHNQCDTRLSLLAGLRYASLDQRLDVVGNTAGTTAANPSGIIIGPDVDVVHTQVNFEGGGLRIGFEGQRRTPYGIVFYGRTAASVVAGTFRCNHTETSGLNGTWVDTTSSIDRVVPIIDAELGAGLSFWNDKLRLTAGYSFSGWFNTVLAGEYISATQSNDYTGMHNTLTFDGFVSRVELAF